MLQSQERINVQTAYFLALISDIFFPIAVWLFFYSKFLSFTQIALLTSLTGFAAILFEVPTGVFADMFGRRRAIVFSYLIYTAAMIGVAFSQTFVGFLWFGLMAALANALYSGSLEALVYDSLLENQEIEKFEQVTSRMEALTWVGLFVGAVVGGLLYQVNNRLPYFVQAAATLIAAGAALRLYEPKIDSHTYSFKLLLTQNMAGVKELFKTRSIALTSLFFITIAAGYHIAAQILGISQAREYGMQPVVVGLLFGFGFLLSAFFSHLFPRMRKVLGDRLIVCACAVSLLSSFLLAQFVGMVAGAGLIMLRIASSASFRNSRALTFNALFSSKNRATALSTFNLLSTLPYVVLAYAIGDTIDRTSPNQFAFAMGVVLVLVLGGLGVGWVVEKNRGGILHS